MDAAIQLILAYRYLILLPLAFVEGPVVSFLVGFFVSTGHVDLVPAFLILLVADLVRDTVSYGLGRFGETRPFVRRYVGRSGIGQDQFAILRNLWHVHGVKTMFVSKLAYGLSTPFLISAGLVALPWQRFVILALTVSATQYAGLMTLGYFFGSYVGVAADLVWWIEMAAAVLIVAGMVYYFVGRRVRQRLLDAARQQAERTPE